jgi:hypothetical protein
LRIAEEELAKALPPDKKRLWDAAKEVGPVCAAALAPTIWAEELEYDVFPVNESDAQHEVTDCEAIPIHNLPPMYALTSTGRVVPMRSALEAFEIQEIIKDKKVRDGRKYLVRWAHLQLPTWEHERNLSPSAIRQYDEHKLLRKRRKEERRAQLKRTAERSKEKRRLDRAAAKSAREQEKAQRMQLREDQAREKTARKARAMLVRKRVARQRSEPAEAPVPARKKQRVSGKRVRIDRARLG